MNQNHSKPFKTIQNHSKPFKTIQNHSKPFKTIKNHPKNYSKNNQSHQKPSKKLFKKQSKSGFGLVQKFHLPPSSSHQDPEVILSSDWSQRLKACTVAAKIGQGMGRGQMERMARPHSLEGIGCGKAVESVDGRSDIQLI